MKLTVRTLKKHGACVEAVDWVKGQKDISYKALFTACLAEDHLDWANWIIPRLLNKENRIRYAIYAAERVIKIYEDKYPDDAYAAYAAAYKETLTKTLKYGYGLLIKQEGGTP